MYNDVQNWPIYLKYGPILINKPPILVTDNNIDNTVFNQHFSIRYLHILN